MDTKILILEDSRLDVELIVNRLQQADISFEYRHVDRRASYENSLAEFKPDLILSDFKLPDINGFEAIEINESREYATPLIVISGAIGEENAADVIKAGAVDYVSKDHPERLPLAVKRALREQEQQRRRVEAEAQALRLERRLGYLFDNSLDGILFIRGNGDIIAANPAACDMLGYRQSEITRLSRRDLLDESDPDVREAIAIREKEDRYRGKLEFIRKDGSILPVELTINFEEENTDLEGGYAIFRDISSQREYEQALRREKDLQKLLKDIGLVINDDLDTDSALQYCTELLCDYLDWPVGHIYLINEITGELVSSDIWHCTDLRKFKSFLNDTTRRSYSLGEGLLGEVYNRKEPRFVEDLAEQKNFKRILICQKYEIQSGIVFPVVAWNEPVAIMEFYSDLEEEYDPVTMEHVGLIGEHIGQLLERKLAQDLMEEKEQMFRLLAENSTDMITRHDPDGTVLYVSPASEKLFGYKPGELIGTNMMDYLHPDDVGSRQESGDTLPQRNFAEAVKSAYRLRTKSGGYRWVETLNTTVFDSETGETVELQASTRDISERIEYEENLRRAKIFSENVINSLPELFFILDENLEIDKVNKNFVRTLGYEYEDVYTLKFTDLVIEQEREKVRTFLERAATEEKKEIEVRLVTGRGDTLPVIIGVTQMEIGYRRLFLGTGIDISERIEAEQQLLQHRQLLQSMMDQSKAMIYVKEKDGRFRFVNQAFLNLFGLTEEDVIGKRDIDIMDKDYVEPMRTSDLEALESGQPVELEEQVESDGDMKVFLSTKTPLKNVEGFEDCVCGISTEITGRKKIEENIREALNEKKILLMEIHHRVKNNLAVISGLMHLQASRSEHSDVVEQLMNCQSRVKSMAVIHEMLYQSDSFSRLNFKDNITHIVRHIAKSIQTDVEIDVDLDVDPVELNVNQALPCTLILNELLTNIYKYAFEGRDKGKVELGLVDKNGEIRIELSDNGVGLSDDFKIKDSSTLGMKLVDVLSKQLEAELQYQSDETGTRFVITFEKKEVTGIGNSMVED